jgi:nitrate reductase delta subunit
MKTLFKRAGRTQDVATICQVAAVLLDYPRDGDEWVLSTALPPQLRAFADDWFALDLTDRQERYVAAFDLRRRTPLHVTYLTHGDTRNRGAAMLQLKHVLTRHGFTITSGELPDYLPLLLEFASVEPRGLEVLGSYRRSVELLRRSLADLGDPFAVVVDQVAQVLPSLDEADLAAVIDIARNGPPNEDVGLGDFEPMTMSEARR